MKLVFPEHNLVLEDRANAILVAQGQKEYLARKWQLTDQVIGIVHLALAKGLTCLWQQGHPGGGSSHHISFSFSHKPASWVFCIGDGAGAPLVRKVTLSKKVRGLFEQSGFKPFWESAGGKNFSIIPEDLPAFLDLVEKSRLKDILDAPPLSLHKRQITQIADFQSEKELEDSIVEALRNGGAKLHRQRRFKSSHFPDGQDIPDVVIDAGKQAIVVELKLYRAIEPDIVQLSRYLANAKIRMAFENCTFNGVLIAAGFDKPIQDAAAAMGNCSLYSYAAKTGLPLRPIAGPDVLGRFFSN
jgi:hypothetical protein